MLTDNSTDLILLINLSETMVLRYKEISSYRFLNHLVFLDKIPNTEISSSQVVAVKGFKLIIVILMRIKKIKMHVIPSGDWGKLRFIKYYFTCSLFVSEKYITMQTFNS